MAQDRSRAGGVDVRVTTGQRTRICAYCRGSFEAVRPLDHFCRPSCRKGFVDDQRWVARRGSLLSRLVPSERAES
jgi:hypothetical protein